MHSWRLAVDSNDSFRVTKTSYVDYLTSSQYLSAAMLCSLDDSSVKSAIRAQRWCDAFIQKRLRTVTSESRVDCNFFWNVGTTLIPRSNKELRANNACLFKPYGRRRDILSVRMLTNLPEIYSLINLKLEIRFTAHKASSHQSHILSLVLQFSSPFSTLWIFSLKLSPSYFGLAWLIKLAPISCCNVVVFSSWITNVRSINTHPDWAFLCAASSECFWHSSQRNIFL